MQVNICYRLIKYNIERGVVYSRSYFDWDSLPKCLYATQDYKLGDIIRVLRGELILKPTRESIHIGNNMHVIDEYGKYINHSFEPNTRIELNKVIALKDIKKYEEITFNYNESEINMAEPFESDGIRVCGIKNT